MRFAIRSQAPWLVALSVLAVLVLIGIAAAGARPVHLAVASCVAVVVVAGVYLLTVVDPAWVISLAITLGVFSGNWGALGVPGSIAPDRLLLFVGIVALLLRDPLAGARPRLRFEPVHWLLVLAALYAICSAFAAGTLFRASALFPLVDRYGILPFLLFTIAPVAFATERQRQILLGAFVALSAYLGLTALFEAVGARALVFPRYILDPEFGFQQGRARGPFAESAVNGVALFVCAVACTVAWARWRGRARWLALALAALCALDLTFTLQRSVWIGGGAATVVALAAFREGRRYLAPVVVGVALAVPITFTAVPGLYERAKERFAVQETVWDRKNLNRAAQNMVAARPLVGFGWGTFRDRSVDYFEQADDFPFARTTGNVHNVFLGTAAELGLIGALLWGAALIAVLGGAVLRRGPPELRPWRIGLLAVGVAWLVAANLTPLAQPFPNEVLWLWAGIVWPRPPPVREA